MNSYISDVGRYIKDSKLQEYEFMFGIATMLAFISIFVHIISALSALIDSEGSKSIRKTAGTLTIILIIIARIAVGKLASDIEIIESTWTWIILGVIVLIDMYSIAPKIGKKIDYSNNVSLFEKPNLPNEALLQRGVWKCSACSKINASYVNTCSCGNVNKKTY